MREALAYLLFLCLTSAFFPVCILFYPQLGAGFQTKCGLVWGDEFYFKPLLVFEVEGVVVGAACVRVSVCEEFTPAVAGSLVTELIEQGRGRHGEGQVVETGVGAVMGAGGIGGFFEDEVGAILGLPGDSAGPLLIGRPP